MGNIFEGVGALPPLERSLQVGGEGVPVVVEIVPSSVVEGIVVPRREKPVDTEMRLAAAAPWANGPGVAVGKITKSISGDLEENLISKTSEIASERPVRARERFDFGFRLQELDIERAELLRAIARYQEDLEAFQIELEATPAFMKPLFLLRTKRHRDTSQYALEKHQRDLIKNQERRERYKAQVEAIKEAREAAKTIYGTDSWPGEEEVAVKDEF
jgi:hypothetical protein